MAEAKLVSIDEHAMPLQSAVHVIQAQGRICYASAPTQVWMYPENDAWQLFAHIQTHVLCWSTGCWTQDDISLNQVGSWIDSLYMFI